MRVDTGMLHMHAADSSRQILQYALHMGDATDIALETSTGTHSRGSGRVNMMRTIRYGTLGAMGEWGARGGGGRPLQGG